MTNITNEQLEAWAGLNAKAVIARLAGIETPQMKGDNLAVTLCNYFENPDQEEDENGWTPDAIKGYDDVMVAIREHLAPLAAAPDLARLVLEKDAEIAELKFEAGMKDKGLRLALKCLGELTNQTGTYALFASDMALIRQAMKETSDE